MDKIVGYIVKQKEITGKLQIPDKLPVHDKYPEYEGSYTVVPLVREQILPTKERSMEDDMTVEAINYLEVDNPEGGKTVTIGFE